VYTAPRQHFGAVIAVMQPGGAKVDIEAIRMLQEVPQPLPRMGIDAKMRGILVDCLVTLHAAHRFQSETLYLAVTLLDGLVSRGDVDGSRMHIILPAVMLIANKLAGVAPNEVDVSRLAFRLAGIAQNAHNTSAILPMEISVLAGLQFNIDIPRLSIVDIVQRFDALHAPTSSTSLASVSCQQYKRTAKKSAYPTPPRPHGGKHLRRAGALGQPGGRQRGRDRRAPRK